MKNETYQKKLEELIHQKLRNLPEQEAPATLAPRVMAAIEAASRKPWWQKPWSSWPTLCQAAFLALLAGVAGGTTYGAAAAWNHASLPAVAKWLDPAPILALWEGLGALGNALWLVLQSFGQPLIYAMATAGVCLYLACVAFGVAWWRVAFQRTTRPAAV